MEHAGRIVETPLLHDVITVVDSWRCWIEVYGSSVDLYFQSILITLDVVTVLDLTTRLRFGLSLYSHLI